jgi:hypothetical protein
MQSPVRALLYGIAIWFVWVSLVVVSAQLLPTEISGSALFVSMKMVALATLVLGFTILYLHNAGEGSFNEGLLIGLSWAVILIALDLGHSVLHPDMVSLDTGTYFATVVPSYVVIPIITALAMGYLERRSLKPRS